MARVSRLKGAILAESGPRYYLVGHPKEPLDFGAFGFEDPGTIKAPEVAFVELIPVGKSRVSSLDPGGNQDILEMDLEGEVLARKLAQSFMIERNGSISERLWGLVTETTVVKKGEALDVDWLTKTPEDVWNIVRDAVLRC